MPPIVARFNEPSRYIRFLTPSLNDGPTQAFDNWFGYIERGGERDNRFMRPTVISPIAVLMLKPI